MTSFVLWSREHPNCFPCPTIKTVFAVSLCLMYGYVCEHDFPCDDSLGKAKETRVCVCERENLLLTKRDGKTVFQALFWRAASVCRYHYSCSLWILASAEQQNHLVCSRQVIITRMNPCMLIMCGWLIISLISALREINIILIWQRHCYSWGLLICLERLVCYITQLTRISFLVCLGQ